jgi:hypothetical protein
MGDMAIRELIEMLEDVAQEHDDNVIVRLGIQPRWAFEHSIGAVETASQTKREIRDKAPAVCYIGEGSQLGYLPQAGAVALGWSDHDEADEADDECGDVPAGTSGVSCTRPAGHAGLHGDEHETWPQSPDACPGCGCVPGEGRTSGCTHADGCGATAEGGAL